MSKPLDLQRRQMHANWYWKWYSRVNFVCWNLLSTGLVSSEERFLAGAEEGDHSVRISYFLEILDEIREEILICFILISSQNSVTRSRSSSSPFKQAITHANPTGNATRTDLSQSPSLKLTSIFSLCISTKSISGAIWTLYHRQPASMLSRDVSFFCK